MDYRKLDQYAYKWYELHACSLIVCIIDVKVFATTPSLTNIIPSVDDYQQVVGLTAIDSRLFVLFHPSRHQIQVYDTTSLTLQQQTSLQINGLSDETLNSGLTSCDKNRCLYISDSCEDTVYKVKLQADGCAIFHWPVNDKPMGLSVNKVCNLLVACWSSNKIQEFTTDGLLVRDICPQPSTVVVHPWHAVQLNDGQYVVSYMDKKRLADDVVEMDAEGRVVARYTNWLISEFDCPRHLATDTSNKFIIITDSRNGRLMMVYRKQKRICRLNVPLYIGMEEPSCVFYDESCGRLFVGEYEGRRRILVFDNVVDVADSVC